MKIKLGTSNKYSYRLLVPDDQAELGRSCGAVLHSLKSVRQLIHTPQLELHRKLKGNLMASSRKSGNETSKLVLTE